MSEVNIDNVSGADIKRGSMISGTANGSGGSDPRVMRELRLVIKNTVGNYHSALKHFDGDLAGFKREMREFINSLERLYKQWVLFENL